MNKDIIDAVRFGLGSVVDMSIDIPDMDNNKSGFEKDWEKLGSDWKKIGNDIRKAEQEYKKVEENTK